MLVTYVCPQDKKLGIKAVRHLALFAWLLKDRLRDTNSEDIKTLNLKTGLISQDLRSAMDSYFFICVHT